MDRRTFLAGSVALVAHSTRAQPARELHVTLVHAGLPDEYADGIAFGLDESQRSAALFGRRLLLERREATPPGPASIVISTHRDPDALAEYARATKAPLLNVACSSDRSRVSCTPNVFHLVPSNSARLKALESLQPSPLAPARVELWHHDLERFGAAQLNERFANARRRPMTSADWAGWLALKITVETWLRTGSGDDAAALLAALTSSRLRYDGHKGTPLVFGPDHELRQPLYVVTAGGPRELAAVETTPGRACMNGER